MQNNVLLTRFHLNRKTTGFHSQLAASIPTSCQVDMDSITMKC